MAARIIAERARMILRIARLFPDIDPDAGLEMVNSIVDFMPIELFLD